MNPRSVPQNPRVEELLLDRATVGLSPDEALELQRLLDETGAPDTGEFDLAAAAADLALCPPERGALPERLRVQILADAGRFVSPPLPVARDTLRMKLPAAPPRRGRRGTERIAWLMTAIAAGLALLAWIPRWQSAAPPTSTVESVAQRRERLLRDAGVLRVPWNRPEDPAFAQVSGDVVWSPTHQEGYLRLGGMPANDPAVAQYQLWIVDPTRDKHPIDGGVFDIPATGGDVIIPIVAKLKVNDAKVFAITREKPGGVVVSGGPLLVVAAAGS